MEIEMMNKNTDTNFVNELPSLKISLRVLASGELILSQGEKEVSVYVHRCFPWSNPLNYLSLRDAQDGEHLLIRDLSDLDEKSQLALLEALKASEFCFQIEDIFEVFEEYELRVWKVRTDSGPRTFQTKLTDWPKSIPGGRYIVQDVYKDVFVMSPFDVNLPERAKKILSDLIDLPKEG